MTVQRWGELTSAELAAAAARDPVAVLPLAAVEQHGPHLPLETDCVIGEGLLTAAASRLPPDCPVLRLPVLSVGDSLEHTRFPGTLSLDPETFQRVVVEWGAGVARAGVRRLLLFSSHGGNLAGADVAALRLRHDHGLLVVRGSYFRFPPPADALPAEELRVGLHGGALETALMLHLAPTQVRRRAIAPAGSLDETLFGANRWLSAEGPAGFAWMAGDLAPGGVTGNAALATPALGERLVGHFAEALAGLIAETRAFPLQALQG